MYNANSENSGIPRSNNYVMLANYCGPAPVPLGVQSVAPVFSAVGVDPRIQNIPVFAGVDYNEPPYKSGNGRGIMYRCGNCGGNYCNALKAYGVDTDKMGNPMPEATQKFMEMVPRGSDQVVNQKPAMTAFKTGPPMAMAPPRR